MPHPHAFTLPLSPEQFTDALHKGHGRALMHVRQFGLEGLEEVLLDACLHFCGYDQQLEGDRAPWLVEVIAATGAESRIAEKLLPHLDVETDNDETNRQRCRLARIFAQRGIPGARERLLAWIRDSPHSHWLCCEEDIIELEGAAGLLAIAAHYGTRLPINPELWVDASLIRSFDDMHGKGSAQLALRAAATESLAVAEYLRQAELSLAESEAYIAEHNARPPGSLHPPQLRLQRMSVAELIKIIDDYPLELDCSTAEQWGRFAPDDARREIFETMLEQTHPRRIVQYLQPFLLKAMPELDLRLLPLADHADADVRNTAYEALSHYTHPKVRALAAERLTIGCPDRWLPALLYTNYQPGDHTLINNVLSVDLTRDEVHGLGRRLMKLYESNPLPECAEAMHYVYQHGPCSDCRTRAVALLCKLDLAPEWMKEECKHDAEPGTRVIALH